jgi:multiple sugar transport system substrate-binding protein
MPTINDIARLAGVSHGTVSNVLNKRGNVSIEKITLVENAARALGFKLNAQAKQLRQGNSQRVAIIVPQISIKRYRDLFMGISLKLMSTGLLVDFYCSDGVPYQERELLERILSSNPTAVVMVSSFVKNLDLFDSSTQFIFVERLPVGIPPSAVFFGFDYAAAGRELARECIDRGHKRIAIFQGPPGYSCNKQFAKGCKAALDESSLPYSIFAAEDTMGLYLAFSILSRDESFDCVLVAGLENAEYLKIAHSYDPGRPLPAIFALASADVVPADSIVKYELNYKYCGFLVGAAILRMQDAEGKQAVPRQNILSAGGVHAPFAQGRATETRAQLNFLILDSPTCKALRVLLPTFTRATGISVKLIEVSYEELYKSAFESGASVAYDLIRLDMAWLSVLGPKIFIPLNLDESPYREIRESFSCDFPEEYYATAGIDCSLPFDVSAQILYYRKDLFSDARLCRLYYERYRRQLAVPRDFDEYNEVARFFTKKYNPESPTQYGTSLVYGTSVIAAAEVLPRLKAIGGSIFDDEGRVNVLSAEFKEALQSYIDTFAYTSQQPNRWWTQPMEEFARGDIAMNIVFCNHASAMVQDHNSSIVGKIGWATVPGGHPLIGGGVVGISRNSAKKAEADELLRWIYSDRTAAMITYLGGYINNKKLQSNVDVLELYPWTNDTEKALSIGWRRSALGNSNFDEYMFEGIIGSSIRNAVIGLVSVDQALSEAQKRCDEAFNS